MKKLFSTVFLSLSNFLYAHPLLRVPKTFKKLYFIEKPADKGMNLVTKTADHQQKEWIERISSIRSVYADSCPED
jgi:hypothetical protein